MGKFLLSEYRLKDLEPAGVFRFFEEICSIPHGSGNTEKISNYLVSFAEERRLAYRQDESGNVVIFKDASAGFETSAPVILQGHMDMVCVKRPSVVHDFEKDGLDLSVDNGMLHASGTTLGGDDGIAVAYGLALLDDDSIPHPPLEVLFTVDEEIGLLGAAAFDTSVLKGRRLINLDSEEEGILWIACAGGLHIRSELALHKTSAKGVPVTVVIDGLLGGHSGGEIHKNRASANALMGRVLYSLEKDRSFGLYEIRGGEKDNAIPKDCTAKMLVMPEDLPAVMEICEKLEKDLRNEYTGSDEGISIHAEAGETAEAVEMEVLDPTSQEKVIFFLRNFPFGVQKMSGTIDGLVETSLNLGILSMDTDQLVSICSIRSSVGSAKKDLAEKIGYLTEFLGGEYFIEGEYPAWEYRKDSPLRDTMFKVFCEEYGKEPQILAIHAGLECGLFYEKIPGLDCVSIGPDMKDIHTSEEQLDIASARRTWEYLLKVLQALK